MRCNICDVQLTEKETVYNPQVGGLEPCTTCLDIAYDAAYGRDLDDEVLDTDWDGDEEEL